MANEWSKLSNDELARIAQNGLQGQGAPVEAMRRLRDALERASAKSDTYSRRMLWLTVAIFLLTAVQVIAAFPDEVRWIAAKIAKLPDLLRDR
jgi:hypothetical protein